MEDYLFSIVLNYLIFIIKLSKGSVYAWKHQQNHKICTEKYPVVQRFIPIMSNNLNLIKLKILVNALILICITWMSLITLFRVAMFSYVYVNFIIMSLCYTLMRQ